MSMVEYMYKLLYGRRLTSHDAATQQQQQQQQQQQLSSSVPAELLRLRLSHALRHSCDNTSANSKCRSQAALVHELQPSSSSPASRCWSPNVNQSASAAAAAAPDSVVTPVVCPETHHDAFNNSVSCNLFSDLVGGNTFDNHEFLVRHLDSVGRPQPLLRTQTAVYCGGDLKPSCRYSRSSSTPLTDASSNEIKFSYSAQFVDGGEVEPGDRSTSWCDGRGADVAAADAVDYRYSRVQSASPPVWIGERRLADVGDLTAKYDDVDDFCGNISNNNNIGRFNVDDSFNQGINRFAEYGDMSSSWQCSGLNDAATGLASIRWQEYLQQQQQTSTAAAGYGCWISAAAAAAAAAATQSDMSADAVNFFSSAATVDRCGLHQSSSTSHHGVRQCSGGRGAPHGRVSCRRTASGGGRAGGVGGLMSVSTSSTSGHGLLCAVCGDTAACQHYGVRTCEGCKGFFKRTVQKNSKYVCLSGRNCIIDKRRRNRCQYCRFQKCLAVGMVKEVVRRDTLKGRRGRLPSKPRNVHRAAAAAAAAGGLLSLVPHHQPAHPPPSPPISFITALVRAHVDSSPDLPSLDYSQYRDPSHSTYTDTVESCSRLCHHLLERSVLVIRQWAESVPGFTDLCHDDRQLLFRCSLLEVFSLRLADRLKPGDNRVTFCDGSVLHTAQCQLGFDVDWFQSLVTFAESLHVPHSSVDLSSISCLAGLVLITDRHGLREPHRVEELQELIVDALRTHCAYRYGASFNGASPVPTRRARLAVAKVLGRLSELRSLGRQCLDVLRRTCASLHVVEATAGSLSDAASASLCFRILAAVDNSQQN